MRSRAARNGVSVKAGASSEHVRINGLEGDDCEDFLWFRGIGPGMMLMDMQSDDNGIPPKFSKGVFFFCKTRRCDYDTVVVAILCAIQDIYGEELVEVSSDGDMNGSDWEAGRALYAEVLADCKVKLSTSKAQSIENA
eukprot:gene3202-3505_t